METSGINIARVFKIRVQYAFDDDRDKKFIREFHSWHKYISWLNEDKGIHVLQICHHYSYSDEAFKFIDSRKEKKDKLKMASKLLDDYEKMQQSIW